MDLGYYESLRDIEQKVTHILLYNCETNIHYHGSLEILYVIKGKINYTSNINHSIICEGEAIFIPPFFAHSLHSLTETETQTIIIPSKYLKDYNFFFKNNYFGKLSNKDINKKLLYALNEIACYQTKNVYNELFITGIVDYILGIITINYSSIPYKKVDSLMVDITAYINNNFKNNISLEDIANNFGYNKTYFSRLFKTYFNCSLNDFINIARCNYIFMNRKSNKSITDLIYEAGFASTSSFYRFNKLKNKSSFKKN